MLQTVINTRGARMGKFISNSHSVEMCLGYGDLFKLESDRRFSRIRCLEGALWVTQEGDPNDHMLEVGQGFTVARPGLVLIQGQPEGRFELISFESLPNLPAKPAIA